MMYRMDKTKRIVAGLLCLLILFSTASVMAEKRTIRTGYMVRLRAKPSSSSKVLDAYPVGTTVNVLDKGTSWCKVRGKGKTTGVKTCFRTSLLLSVLKFDVLLL